MNYIHFLHDHRPYEKNTTQGVAISIAKRAAIGLIFATALAVGSYFYSMTLYNNPSFGLQT